MAHSVVDPGSDAAPDKVHAAAHDAVWQSVATTYRRAIILAAGTGVIAIGVCVAVGRPIAGLLICGGLGLGVYNARRLWTETARAAETLTPESGRRPFVVASARRLGFVTAVAFAVALIYRPLGWTVFLGLVMFQLVMLANVAGPLKRAKHQ